MTTHPLRVDDDLGVITITRGRSGVALTRTEAEEVVTTLTRILNKCTCSTWWVDVDPSSPTYGEEYDQGGGERERRYSLDPECPVHGQETR